MVSCKIVGVSLHHFLRRHHRLSLIDYLHLMQLVLHLLLLFRPPLVDNLMYLSNFKSFLNSLLYQLYSVLMNQFPLRFNHLSLNQHALHQIVNFTSLLSFQQMLKEVYNKLMIRVIYFQLAYPAFEVTQLKNRLKSLASHRGYSF